MNPYFLTSFKISLSKAIPNDIPRNIPDRIRDNPGNKSISLKIIDIENPKTHPMTKNEKYTFLHNFTLPPPQTFPTSH